MSLLIEASCLVARNDSLDAGFPGGVDGFAHEALARCQPRYVVTDGTFIVVSAWEAQQLFPLVERLDAAGLEPSSDGTAGDWVPADMDVGTLMPCPWLTTDMHRNGFRWAWATGEEPGEMAFPDLWRPQDSWKLDRTRLQDAGADAVLPLGPVEDGGESVLDFRTGNVVLVSDATSSIVSVPPGGESVKVPALEDLRLATAQLLLRIRNIPYRVDTEQGRIIVMFALDDLDEEQACVLGDDGLLRLVLGVGDIPRSLVLDVCLPLPAHYVRLVSPLDIHEAADVVTAETGGVFELCEESGTMSVRLSITAEPEAPWSDAIERMLAYGSQAGTRMCVGLAIDA